MEGAYLAERDAASPSSLPSLGMGLSPRLTVVCVLRVYALGSLFLYAREAHLAFLSTVHKIGHSPDLKEAESRVWKLG